LCFELVCFIFNGSNLLRRAIIYVHQFHMGFRWARSWVLFNFCLYMLLLYIIFTKYNVSYHCYTDDTQYYVPEYQYCSLSIGFQLNIALRSKHCCLLIKDCMDWVFHTSLISFQPTIMLEISGQPVIYSRLFRGHV